jgi:ATP-dependent RNA helicase DeaD
MKFEEMKIKPEIMRAVKELGFNEATEIQAKCIPTALEGKDIIGQSQTGSGKTAAFGLPILSKINKGEGLQAIILTPTRELCVQVNDAIKSFAKYTGIKTVCVYGGVSIEPQISGLRQAELVVGTPGRVLDHIDRRTMNLSKIRFFVLDEADKMLEMGFIDDIKVVLRNVPKDKQALLFSATMAAPIKAIIRENFKNPIHIQGQSKVDRSLLKQTYYNLRPDQKFSLLVHLLKTNLGISLVFCATRHEVDMVESNLNNNGLKAKAIHGGLTQNRRMEVVEALKKEHIQILVATDVAARGLDIRNITHVYNYDLPKNSDEYIHRIGRTARAGESGEAVTLLTQHDYQNFQSVLTDRTIKVDKREIPPHPIVKFERHVERRSFDQNRPHQGRNNTNHHGRAPFRGPARTGFSSHGNNDDRHGRNDRNSDRREGSSEGRNERTESESRSGSFYGSNRGGRPQRSFRR